MAFKRDSWLVKGVLIIAVAAFVAVPILFAFNGRTSSRGANAPTPTAQTAADEKTKLQGTIDGYQAVLEREPDNRTALEGIIDAKIKLGDLAGSVEPLERLAELNPDTPEYSILLAQTKQQLDDLEGAAQVYRRVLTQKPGNLPALEGLVALLVGQDRTEAAVGLLQDTLNTADQTNELAPGSVDKLSVKLLLGQVFIEQEKYDEAVKIYDEAIADAKVASPTQPDFRPTLAKGLVLQEQGDETAAKALFDEALAMSPTQYKDGVQKLIREKTAPAAAAEGAKSENKVPTGSNQSGSQSGNETDGSTAPPAE
ncbi:MAG: tetratricopeptide repeat protein [Phormidesmis sp.]